MNGITGIVLCGMVVGTAAAAAAAEIVIREYPDRIVAECDGSKDPKAPSQAPVTGDSKGAGQESLSRMDEQTMTKVRNKAEERMERNRLRMEYNQQEVERRKKEQEEAW